jgi:hypothetical protein
MISAFSNCPSINTSKYVTFGGGVPVYPQSVVGFPQLAPYCGGGGYWT